MSEPIDKPPGNSPTDGKSPKRGGAHQTLADAARASLLRRERQMDGETLSRLRRARYAALEQNKKRSGVPVWIAAWGACAAALALALWLPDQVSDRETIPASDGGLLADTWLLDEEAELEMIEDVEFYQWLAEEALDGRSS